MRQVEKILMLMLSMAILVSLMASVTVSAEGNVTIPVVTAVNIIIDGTQTPYAIENAIEGKFNAFATNGSAPGNSIGLDGAMMNEYTAEGYLQINGVLKSDGNVQSVALQNFTLTVGNRYTMAVELKAKGEDTKVALYNSCDLWSDAGKTVKIPKSYEYMTLKKGDDWCGTWDDDSAKILTDFVFHGTYTESNMTVSSTQTKKSFLVFQEVDPAVNKGYIIKSIDLKEHVIENITVTALEATAEKTDLSADGTTKISVTANGEYNVTDSEYISFQSSNTAVAKVDENGNVTAIGGGKATITATLSDGTNSINDIVEISVSGPASEITIPVATESTVIINRDNTMQENDSKNLKKAYLGNNIVQDELYTDNGVALHVPPTGVNSNTQATVTNPAVNLKHTYKAGYTYKISAKVKAYNEPTEVKITSSKAIDINNSGQVNDCAYYNEYFNGITKAEWVDIASEITYHGYKDGSNLKTSNITDLFNIREGRRNINYGDTSNKGFYIKNVCLIESKMEDMTLNNLEVSADKANIKVGETARLSAKATEAGTSATYDVTENSNISYVSNNTAVATVDANGKITAKSAGAATITVRLGKTGEGYLETTAEISVSQPSVKPSVSASNNIITRKNATILDKKWDYTAYLYSTVDFGSGYEAGDFGFELVSDGDNEEEPFILPVVISENGDETPEAFAIRVVGNNIAGSYTAVPYIYANGEKIMGNTIKFTFDENTQSAE